MTGSLYKSYIICTSPRSGSTLLCRLLAATGDAGNPDSHFHAPDLDDWLHSFGLAKSDFRSDRAALGAVFEAAIAAGKEGADLFGLRLQGGSFDFLMRQLAMLYPDLYGDSARLKAAFGQTLFIHLTRTDKVQQAISLVKARQTGLWHQAPDGTELERLAPPGLPIYDAAAIATAVEQMTEMDTAWQKWFARERIEPLRITYDRLADDPAQVLETIRLQLGLDPTLAQGIVPPVARLSDATNRQWEAWYRSDTLAADIPQD